MITADRLRRPLNSDVNCKNMKTIITIFMTFIIYLPQFSLAEDKINLGTMPPFYSTQLSNYTTNDLINYLTIESVNWHFQNKGGQEIEFKIVDELIRRKDIAKLINAFENPKDNFQKEKMMDALYQIDDQVILSTFKKYISPNDTTRTMYYCLNYLAKYGDMEALKILNNNYFQYPVPSWQWSYTVRLFGKFLYIPATENLISSLDAASLHLVDAAIESLQMLYPDASRDFESPEEAKNRFKEYINQLN